jgi:hypothetical protein
MLESCPQAFSSCHLRAFPTKSSDEMEKNPKKRRKRQTWGLGAIIIIRRDLTDDAINLSIALVFANCQSG